MDYGDIFMDSPSAHEYMSQLQAQSSANNAFNAAQAQKQMDFQMEQNAKAMDFSHREAELNRSWQEMMSNSAYQRQVQDMIKAGLNPVLGISNSGASTPSGASASGVTSTGSKAEADTSINTAFSNFVGALINGATSRDVANISAAAAMHNAEVSAGATKYAAGLNAAASRYAADVAAANVAAELFHDTEMREKYPQTYAGLTSSLLQGSGISDLLKGLGSSDVDNFKSTASNIISFVQNGFSGLKNAAIKYLVNDLKNENVNSHAKEVRRDLLYKLYSL